MDSLLTELLAEVPALLLVGPRATGKTTTAGRHARTIVRLDQPSEAVAFAADPDAALRGLAEPALLDEWQAVPSVLGAVKRAVGADPRAGRYLVAGSVRADLEAENWPGTGRLVRVPMTGLVMREIIGRVDGPTFLDRASAGVAGSLALPDEVPDLRGYVDLALRSGFPEPALRLSERVGQRWLESYLDQLLTRDAGLVGAALRLDTNATLRDGNLLGRILDTFVAAQLRAEPALNSSRPRVYHLRQEGGRREIDLVAELAADRVVAIEVKADAAPGWEASQHLRWLRDELGDRFLAGVVLHTGPRVFPVSDRILAAPICAMWGP